MDELRSGRPITDTKQEIMEQVHNIVSKDPNSEITVTKGISVVRVLRFEKTILKISATFVDNSMTFKQKFQCEIKIKVHRYSS